MGDPAGPLWTRADHWAMTHLSGVTMAKGDIDGAVQLRGLEKFARESGATPFEALIAASAFPALWP